MSTPAKSTKSPAFQFYAKDFLTGTATMSLAERGAYVTLLSHQWDSGSVPSTAKERARMLGCTASEERRIWARLVSKFTLVDDAFQNLRLEEERQKQAEFRRRQSDKGKASAATRWQPKSNHGSTAVTNGLQPNGNSSSSSSSSSSKEQEQIPRPHAKRSDDRFDAWWSAYPKKTGKGAALKAWTKIRPSDTTVAAMLNALEWQRNQPQWQKDGGAFIPNPATYLNQSRWEDEPFFASAEPTSVSIAAQIDAWGRE
jgi:uncharacterized protein YdaU (DUF1376 family)